MGDTISMFRRFVVVLAAVVACLPAGSGRLEAQTRAYATRLSPVPITVAMQETVAGRGAVTASLAGSTLAIDGTFEGLRSPATVARIHLAPRGVRGPAFADLTVARATSGTVKGTLELTERQRQALEKGALYIQIDSEKAPEGTLWGWLLPATSGAERREDKR